MKCTKGNEVQVLYSGGGFYIGTVAYEDGYPEPCCRVSEKYWKEEADAQQALENGFTQRTCEENMFCNQRRGCGITFNK